MTTSRDANPVAASPGAQPIGHSGLNGWAEAGLFAIALSVLNISYALGYQIGAHPVAFLVYAMPVAAMTLLAFTGAGPNWQPIVTHPLSFVVGFGIIAMEAVYYVLLQIVSPADGSLLVRLNVPAAALIGFLLLRRRSTGLGLVGQGIVLVAIFTYAATLSTKQRVPGVLLALACGLIMSLRAFATEMHPWNRSAQTIEQKMRLTGLVLLVTSLLGAGVVFGLMLLVEKNVIPAPGWPPQVHDFLHAPTVALGLFMGAAVLTTMQYLGFSVVLKIQAQNFVATTALIPLVTLVFQIAAVNLGILWPVPIDWNVLPAMLVVAGGVALVIWAGRRVER